MSSPAKSTGWPAREYHRGGSPNSAVERLNMQIQHLIDGAPVPAQTISRRVNPATQEVLAEVARGGEQRSRRGGRAPRRRRFPAGPASPRRERAALLRKLGDLIAQHVPDIARMETRGYRPGDRADREATGAALGGQFSLFRRNVRAGRRPYLSDAHPSQLHAVPSRGRVRPDLALECAVHDRDLEGRSGARVRQHRRAQNERAVAAVGGAAGRIGLGGGNTRGRAQYRAWLRRRGG